MFSNNYQKWDRILGWSVFLIAIITYYSTVEPTTGFWDTGEIIATASNLQIGHPPGAPLLQMIGAFLSMFALETEYVAIMINMVSGVSSAFTILFMFWTITNLTQKLIDSNGPLTNSESITIFGSGIVGCLSFTFSDSFWFNAVETEVYAMASFIMALLLWLGLKWTDNLYDTRGSKWIILISFIVGLTFGIQFMGFLAIPSIGLLFYFKTYKKTNIKNFLLANIIVIALLLFVYKFSLTYVLQVFGWGELFFINSIGLPFNSGYIIVGIGFFLFFYFLLNYTQKKDYRTINTIVLCLLFLFLGFSPWLMLPIRANANVVINENNPADAMTLLAYYNREQYPGVESPVYGTYYSDMFASTGAYFDDKPKYEKNHALGRYIIINKYKDALQRPNSKHQGPLPRMWNSQYAENYMRYFGALDFKVINFNPEIIQAVKKLKKGYSNGEIGVDQYIHFLKRNNEYIEVQPPTIWDNVKYMFEFQFNYMYLRYFMWNFVGKQNDVQGRYNDNGNWLSGINFIDSWRLGSQENLPSDIKNNAGRNTYFFLPLILGIIGIIYQLSKDKKQFWVLLIFFLFTGLAIQFYTNPGIFQPRERDYSLVGSFYIFSIWIGLGVYGLFNSFKDWIIPKILAPTVSLICLLAVPTVMAYQNWDDHDRSNRYTANSSAKAYLDSIKEDSGGILFTIGDNDTFPLWYVQEIEGYRTDVRVLVTSYFETDWYVDQMKRKAYENDPIPSQISHEKYSGGTRDVLYYQKITENRWPVKDFINWIDSDKPQTKLKYLFEQNGTDISQYSEQIQSTVYYPTNKIRVPVNKQNVLNSGLVKDEESDLIVDYIDIDLPEAITKRSMMMLDILANNDWKRPLYFSGGSFDDTEYLWMKDYLQLDGMAYKLVPILTKRPNSYELGRIDTELMYDIVKKWEWGNSGNPNVYIDTQTRIQSLSVRGNLARLMEGLIKDNDMEKAKDIIEISLKNMPVEKFGYYTFLEPYVDGYYKVGEAQKAYNLFDQFKIKYQERLAYYAAIPLDEQYVKIEDIIADMEAYRRNIDIIIANDTEHVAIKETSIFNEYIDKFQHFYKNKE
ncbi:MAG: DUF2723 domain-containing protein [Maribacter litoralis]|uniref:glycosyltransferase family 117 protein n=1 Tax=Maribacter litoralis TaxID=2059726 RepID=UPI0032996F35